MTDQSALTVARRRVTELQNVLELMAKHDPEQEVQGIASPVLDAAVRVVKEQLAEDPVVQTTTDIISPEAIEGGEPVRAVDALLVVGQLHAVLGKEPVRFKAI